MAALTESLTEWLEVIPWQVIATLEFPWTSGTWSADRRFSEFVNLMERGVRGRVCSLSAVESHRRDGSPVSAHIHAALAARMPITPTMVSDTWNHALGRYDPSRSDLARVSDYNPSQGGLSYILKQVTNPDCQWDVHNLEFFNPTMDFSDKRDHAALRSARRWSQQVSVLSPAVS